MTYEYRKKFTFILVREYIMSKFIFSYKKMDYAVGFKV